MASSRNDDIWRLMSQYRFEVDPDSITDNLSCVICNKLMADACHSACGCQYCHKCISDYLRDGDKYCPGGKEACNEDLLVMERDGIRDRALNSKIFNLKVLCPNISCQYKIQLTLMEEHLRLCTQQSVSCPYNTMGCDEENGPKESILTHLHSEMMTHSTLLIEWIFNLKNEIDGLKDNVRTSQSEIVTLKEDSRTKDLQIRKLIEEMESTKERSVIMEIKIITLEEEFNNAKIWIRDLEQQITKLTKENVSVREELKDIKNTAATLDKQLMEYRNETLSKMSAMKEERDQRTRTENDTRSIDALWSRMDKLESNIDEIKADMTVAVGELTFTIDRMIERKKGVDIFSPYFYSHNNGYKLRLIIQCYDYLLRVYLVICKGEYDDLLRWPCQYTFDIGIVDQNKGGTINNVTINYATIVGGYKHLFDKPTNKDNNRYKCLSINDYRSIESVKVNNSVIIICSVPL